MGKLKVGLGSDHAGFEIKEVVKELLLEKGYAVKDFGTHSTESVDYPDYIHPLAKSVEKKENDLGIAVCGSGNGVAMTANKHQGVRAALCWNEKLAELARQHNDANILCLPGRFVSPDAAKKIAESFLNTSFEGGRHTARINKIRC